MLPRQLRTCWLCWNVLSLWKQNTIEDFNGTKQITCNQAWLLVRHINHKEQDSWPWNEKITQLPKLWKPGLLSDVFEFMLISISLLSKTAREGLTAHSVTKTEWKHFYNLCASSMESSKNMRNWQLNRNWSLNCWDPLLLRLPLLKPLLRPTAEAEHSNWWNSPLKPTTYPFCQGANSTTLTIQIQLPGYLPRVCFGDQQQSLRMHRASPTVSLHLWWPSYEQFPLYENQ